MHSTIPFRYSTVVEPYLLLNHAIAYASCFVDLNVTRLELLEAHAKGSGNVLYKSMATCRYRPLLSPWGRRSKELKTAILLCTNFLVLRVLLTTPSISPRKLTPTSPRWLAHGPQKHNPLNRAKIICTISMGNGAVVTERMEFDVESDPPNSRTFGPSLLEIVICIKKAYFPLQFFQYSTEP